MATSQGAVLSVATSITALATASGRDMDADLLDIYILSVCKNNTEEDTTENYLIDGINQCHSQVSSSTSFQEANKYPSIIIVLVIIKVGGKDGGEWEKL